jgi:hypothetical protein
MNLTAKQNLEEKLDDVSMQILEKEHELSQLQIQEKDIRSRLEAMNDVLVQSSKTVKFAKDVDFDKLAGF